MNLERFEKSVSSLENLLREEGFYKNPTQFEIDVFVRLMDFQSQVVIITARLEEDIVENESFTKYIFERIREISETEIEKYSLTLPKLMLDLSDFYIYTRVFLDTLAVCIRHSFKNAGNRNWKIIAKKDKSINCFLNKNKMETYKKKVDFNFFEGLEKKLTWIGDFRKSRDGLLHEYFHFVFTTTRQGDLGFDIMDRRKTSWGTDTVKGILPELQNTIDNLTDLIAYLLANLPKRTEEKL